MSKFLSVNTLIIVTPINSQYHIIVAYPINEMNEMNESNNIVMIDDASDFIGDEKQSYWSNSNSYGYSLSIHPFHSLINNS